MNIVSVVLARGGSKGLPGKNIKELCGHPLMAYTIRPLQECKLINRIIVSTDDEETANVAQSLGAEVPFIRPSDVAQDMTSSEASLKHALDWLKEKENYTTDILVYTQIPDMFKRAEYIDQAIQMLLDDPTLDSAFTAFPDKKKYWKQEEDKNICLTPGKHMSRQKKVPVYREDTGRGCATRAQLIMEEERRLGDKVAIIPFDEEMIDIHTEFDFWKAEQVLLHREEYQRYRL